MEAQARADALAELDRAKTAFFSNVSHEFRTPLTLMLGPTEEALASPERALTGEDLETVHRNELRLLKLVNTLLEFSRLEAGRVTATFEATDLAALTTRPGQRVPLRHRARRRGTHGRMPAAAGAGLRRSRNVGEDRAQPSLQRLQVHVPWLDRRWSSGPTGRMWSCGCGTPASASRPEDIEHVFDRFHRIDRAAARTHEGSGIGLALVRELVGIHGGTIRVSSSLGKGSIFSVRVPFGVAHLPGDQVRTGQQVPAPAARSGATPYVEEALRWLPDEPRPPVETPGGAAPTSAARVLIADDNADMRDYLTRLLSVRYRVESVGDGTAALDAVRSRRPDVIVSDVMMPGLDGFQLVAAVRRDRATREIPIILLSARAGEEARVDGLPRRRR